MTEQSQNHVIPPVKALCSRNNFAACIDDDNLIVCAGSKRILGVPAYAYLLKLNVRTWYPSAPKLTKSSDVINEAEIFKFCAADQAYQRLFSRMAFEILNRLEDGFIEGAMLNRYPGILGQALAFFRKAQYEDFSTLTEMIAEEDDQSHIFITMLNLILLYAKYGSVKYGTEPLTDERVQALFSLLDDIDRAVTSNDHKDRLDVTNRILIRLWPYLKEYIELHSTDAEYAETEKVLAMLPGVTAPASGTTGPAGTPGDSSGSATTAGNRAATKALADDSGDTEGESQDADGAPQEVQAEENSRIPLKETTFVDEPIGGMTEWDTEYSGVSYPNAASDIERILDNIAQDDTYSELERNRLDELNQEAQEIEYGDIHKGVDKVIHRMSVVSEDLIDAFSEAAPKLLPISRRLQRTVLDKLKDRRRGGKQTGLYVGRRIDAHALPRRDGRVFYKNSLPNDRPELCVGVLLDESGSMSGYDRATYARASAIILHDFCVSLGIPIMVYGHSTGCNCVDLYSYAEFQAIDSNDAYRLMDISVRGSNRDGAALRFMMEQMRKRPEEVKLLILVSDGQPADTGYGGTAAEADLRGIKHDCEKAGIMLVAAAIGSDKENISRIYGDAFMDITDLSQMPIRLAEKLKKHIKT